MNYSVGIGITNRCNYNCSHCYSRENEAYDLSFEQVKNLVENVEITSINFGTGESILNGDFRRIIHYLSEKNIKIALTTNGYTTSQLTDEELMLFNDIDFSFDFDHTEQHDALRGIGASKNVIEGIMRCKRLGVECSIACVLMKDNYKIMDKMVEKARELEVNLRINIYKPVHTDKHTLSYDEFWEGIERLFSNAKIVSCSEPIINSLIGVKVLDGGSRCGKNSLRIRPDGKIVPCVYWKEATSSIDELIHNRKSLGYDDFCSYMNNITEETKIIPEKCRDCDTLDICQGGCAARRLYNNLHEPDPYCYKIHGKEKPNLNFEFGETKDLVHSNYLCTIIVC